MTTTKRVFVRTSERTDFAKCRWRWYWAYVDRWRPRESGMNALIFGTMVHRCLADFYIPQKGRGKVKRGRHPAQTWERLWLALDREKRTSEIRITEGDFDKWVEAHDLGAEMMTNYIDHYGQDERYIIIYPEMPFQYDIFNDRGQYICTYVGETDALAWDQETRCYVLLEHKTAATIDTAHLFLDEQASTYWCLIPMWLRDNGILKPDQDLDGMVYNFMRKGQLDTRPQNDKGQYLNGPTVEALKDKCLDLGLQDLMFRGMKKDDYCGLLETAKYPWEQLGEPSKLQPAPLFKREMVWRGESERIKTFERIVAQVREMKAVRSGRMALYKSPSKDCAFCQFKDPCEMDEIGNDTDDLLRQAYRKWNPYKAHIWSLDLDAVA